METEAIVDAIHNMDAQIKDLQARKSELERQLLGNLDNEIKAQVADKEYGCGTATVNLEDCRLKINIPKKVKWDQNELEALVQKIQDSGDNPRDYIKVKYEVPETAYKNWPERIQQAFEPARRVEQGKPTIKIEENE